MAFLNQEEREKLADELVNMKNVNRIKGKLRRMDAKGRLAYFRNVQRSGEWHTRFDLIGIGTRVTIVEKLNEEPKGMFNKNEYELLTIIVEPTDENRT